MDSGRELQNLSLPRVQFSSIANNLRFCIWGCVIASESDVRKACDCVLESEPDVSKACDCVLGKKWRICVLQ